MESGVFQPPGEELQLPSTPAEKLRVSSWTPEPRLSFLLNEALTHSALGVLGSVESCVKSTQHATCIHASMEYVVSVEPWSSWGHGGTEASLCPFPSPQAEERSVTPHRLPILVSLANRAVSFSCITHPYTPKFKDFIVSWSLDADLQGQTSFVEKISCQPGTGSENQTTPTACPITLGRVTRLPRVPTTAPCSGQTPG